MKRRDMIGRASLFALTASFALGAAGVAMAQTITVKYASPSADSDPTQAATIWFMDEVTKRTDGRVQFEKFLGNSLVRDQDIMVAIGDGLIDMGKIYTVSYPGQLPLWTMTNLPFTSPSPYVAINTIRDLTAKFPAFDEELAKLNVKALGVITTGGTGIVSRKPINTVEDLKDFKVRARGVQAAAFTAAGAAPASIPWNDVYEALSKGVVEGSTNYIITTRPIRHNEVAGHYIAAGLGQAVQLEIVNRTFFDALPADIQQVMSDTMREAEDRYAETSAALALSERAALANDPNGKMVYSTLPQAEVDKWQAMSPDFFAEWAKTNEAIADTAAIVATYKELEAMYTEKGKALNLVDMW